MLALVAMMQGSPTLPQAQAQAQESVQSVREPVSAVDSLRIVGAARTAIGFFLDEWRNAWLASEMDFTGRSANIVFNEKYGMFIRNPKVPRKDAAVDDEDPILLYNGALNGDRIRAIHCHLPEVVNRTQLNRYNIADLRVVPVRSSASARSMCPTWVLGPRAGLAAASRVLDSALTSPRRENIRARRAELLNILDSSVAMLPGDDLLTAQRVRFLLDQRDSAGVRHAIESCRASGTTCLLLHALTLAEQGNMRRADSLYGVVDSALTPAARCQWQSIALLLPESERERYERSSCAEQAAVNHVFWWLSDPMFSEAGNERWSVNESRKLWLLLHRAFERDERYNWQLAFGGDAVERMIARYGPPDFSAWGYDQNDKSHNGYLMRYNSAPSTPYTTAEYTIDRWQSVPQWTAVVAPFNATPDMWTLETPRDAALRSWWPDEHFSRARQLTSFDAGQTASFRRQDQLLFATAVDARTPELSASLARRAAVLFLSQGPSYIVPVDEQRAREDGAFVLSALMTSTPVLVSVESPAPAARGADVRVRFGFRPPPTLSAMGQGEIAISEPLLLRGVADPQASIRNAEDAIANMRATTTLTGERKLGVYWESYGLRDADSVEVTIRIESTDAVSTLTRVGAALGVMDDPSRALEIRWREPRPGQSATTLEGPVPVQMRTVQLDLAPLSPGKYRLSIAMGRRGKMPVRSEREFRIQ